MPQIGARLQEAVHSEYWRTCISWLRPLGVSAVSLSLAKTHIEVALMNLVAQIYLGTLLLMRQREECRQWE